MRRSSGRRQGASTRLNLSLIHIYLNGRSKTLFTMFSCCFGALCVRIPLLYLVQTYRPDSLFLLGCVAPLVSGVMAVYTIAYTVRQFRLDLRPALC